MDKTLDSQEMEYYKNHVKNCKNCKEKIKKAQGIEKILHEEGMLTQKAIEACKKLKEMDKELKADGCILTEEMTDFLYNHVPAARKKYIEKHLKECDECRDFLETLKKVEKEYGELKY